MWGYRETLRRKYKGRNSKKPQQYPKQMQHQQGGRNDHILYHSKIAKGNVLRTVISKCICRQRIHSIKMCNNIVFHVKVSTLTGVYPYHETAGKSNQSQIIVIKPF